jgi:hypothetical protein
MTHRPPQTRQDRADAMTCRIIPLRGLRWLLGAFARFYGAAANVLAMPVGAGDRAGSGSAGVHYRKVNTPRCTPAHRAGVHLYTLPYGESGYRVYTLPGLYTQGVHLYTLGECTLGKAGSSY